MALAQQDQFEEAWTLLEAGEPQVETIPEEHAKFLCKKGRVQVLDEKPDAARDSLAQARAIYKQLNLGETSGLGQAISTLESSVDSR